MLLRLPAKIRTSISWIERRFQWDRYSCGVQCVAMVIEAVLDDDVDVNIDELMRKLRTTRSGTSYAQAATVLRNRGIPIIHRTTKHQTPNRGSGR